MRRHPAGLPRPPTERSLRELPARAATFLRAVGTHAPIRAAMASGGYRPEDHDEGLCLLLAVCAYGSDGLDPGVDVPVREASRELASWARTNWARLRAAVARLHPNSAALFGELDGDDEARGVLAVATLLDRLSALEADDPAVLATLTQRGVGPTERSRLAALVATAQRAEAPLTTEPPPRHARASDSALLDLYRWFQDWTTTARGLVQRKDWLIRLGLARRAVSRAGEGT